MTYLINRWNGSGIGDVAPYFRTDDKRMFLQMTDDIRDEFFIYSERYIVWDNLTIWSFALTSAAAEAMKRWEPCAAPKEYKYTDYRREIKQCVMNTLSLD